MKGWLILDAILIVIILALLIQLKRRWRK